MVTKGRYESLYNKPNKVHCVSCERDQENVDVVKSIMCNVKKTKQKKPTTNKPKAKTNLAGKKHPRQTERKSDKSYFWPGEGFQAAAVVGIVFTHLRRCFLQTRINNYIDGTLFRNDTRTPKTFPVKTKGVGHEWVAT